MQSFAGMPLDRFKRALAAFVRELFPTLDYMGFYEYVVVGFDVAAQTADLQAVQDIGLPSPIFKKPIRSPGVIYDLPTGMHVLVGFVNRDPTQAYIAHFDQLESNGFVPTFTGLAGATASDPKVARVGDSVTTHTFSFNPGSGGASLTIDGTPISPTPTSITSAITSGSPKVGSL